MLFQMALCTILTAIVTFMIVKGIKKFKASRLWIGLLIGLWLELALNAVGWTTAVITWNTNPYSLAGAIVISVCNSFGLAITATVHFIFTFKYWVVARKLKQIKNNS